MNVSLTPKLEKMVQKKVASGLYNSASEVIREALRWMEQKEKVMELKLKELRQKVSKGLEQADQGMLLEGEEVFRKLRMRNKSMAKKK